VVDNPERNVPIAALSGVGLAGVVYIAASVAVMGVIPAAELARSTAPFADVVSKLAGGWAGATIAACAALKALGTLGGWILVTGEAGRTGAASGFLPGFASESDPDRLPRRGLLVVGLLMTLTALATLSPTLNKQFNVIVNVAVVLFMAVYVLCSLALLLAKDQGPWVRALAAVALAFSLLAIVAAGWQTTWPALVLLAAAVPLWLVVKAVRGSRRSP
jgi:arginine:agmatine antiporter